MMAQEKMVELKDDTTVTLPSDKEILVTRTLRAPRELVWKAYTEAEHVKQWIGPRIITTTLYECDLRPGGKWRMVQHDADGMEYTFSGENKEVRYPERIVQTWRFDGFPGAESVSSVTFDKRGENTFVKIHVLHSSRENRDAWLSNGRMEWGMREGFQRLDELLPKIA